MQKIVAVLNHLEHAERILGRAVKAAERYDASLELLFVHEAPLFTLPDLLLLPGEERETTIDREKIKDTLAGSVKALGYDRPCAIFVFVDDTADRVAAHTAGERDVLVIAGYHPSLSREIAKICYPPLLILKTERETAARISLPVELDGTAESCIAMARSHFPEAEIRLICDNHYLADREENKRRREAFEKLRRESALEGSYIEEFAWNEADFGEDFEAIEEHLLAAIERDGSDLLLLCSKNGDFLYSEGLTLSLLHRTATDLLLYRHIR